MLDNFQRYNSLVEIGILNPRASLVWDMSGDQKELNAEELAVESAFFNLLTDETLVQIGERLSAMDEGSGVTTSYLGHTIGLDEQGAQDALDLLVDIGALLPVDGTYTPNQNSAFINAFKVPHADQIIGDPVRVAVLGVHIRKAYTPCLSAEVMTELTPFDEEEIAEAQDFLDKLGFLRRGMVLDGRSARENVLADADELLTAVDRLVELTDEDHDQIATDTLDDIVGDVEEANREDEKVLVLRESEFLERVQQAVQEGVESVSTTDGIFTFDAGETGYTLEEDYEHVKPFGRLHTESIGYTQAVGEYVNE